MADPSTITPEMRLKIDQLKAALPPHLVSAVRQAIQEADCIVPAMEVDRDVPPGAANPAYVASHRAYAREDRAREALMAEALWRARESGFPDDIGRWAVDELFPRERINQDNLECPVASLNTDPARPSALTRVQIPQAES